MNNAFSNFCVGRKFSAYAMNVIATCCFGLKINTQDPDDPFVKHGKLLFEPNLVVLGFIMSTVV